MKHSLDKYYLFGIVPFLYKENYKNETDWKLFKFIPVITIKNNKNTSLVKIFGIPLIRRKTKFYSSTWTHRMIKLLSMLPTKRNVVIITDNIIEPHSNIADNFTFFEYLYNSPSKKLVPYYLIEERSQYYKKLKAKYKDKIIGFNSRPTLFMKWKLLTIMPRLKYVCDSFQSIDSLLLNFGMAIKKSRNIFSFFTQHGITYFKPDYISSNIYGFNRFDYVTVSNDMEKEIFLTLGNFPESRIIKNGLFRWDKIEDLSEKSKEKSIFIFFTKRGYINKIKNVESCEYTKQIKKLLNNEKLKDILVKNNIKIKLGLHHSVAENLKNIINGKNIEIISEDDIDNVKQEASLLLTDYSSMCFEFFLQNKPVIFYNIDDSADCKLYGKREDVINPYSGKEQDLFNITKNENELTKLITKYVENDFICEKEILAKESKFFYYKNDFCKRFEEFLISHLEDKKDKIL